MQATGHKVSGAEEEEEEQRDRQTEFEQIKQQINYHIITIIVGKRMSLEEFNYCATTSPTTEN